MTTFNRTGISINFRRGNDKGLLYQGDFNKIPNDAWGAYIYGYILNDNETYDEITYNIYIGETFEIDYLINNPNDTTKFDESLLQSYAKKGYKCIANTKNGIFPLNENDAAYPTYEEMVNAINNIYNQFNSTYLDQRHRRK